ncbi:endolytic transglycosylase MltG [Xylanibacter rodentium]|jgi:UPF0755 protein|uniref:Endolytic murein transglycosylase n=1 Tax=Xylanibacter rodentium TaxID=2736289 RepID=A0ABX2ASW4_9BACT|nr:endolytic transglycosylase MltG [Xylanibacter rodentium]NPE10884.1 endolytic transglycosylase MltG [Prevotella sp. PJ1A]NPE13829.1 endolytic transglycosylase MltG [Xylanibacter rodentium]NPE37753.1 endolytic transglycosylase MltG [Prevotella sp. PCJ2]
MKPIESKYYLYVSGVCLLLIAGIFYYYFFSSFSTSETMQYVYIDDDDTVDSVYAKLNPIAADHSIKGFRTLVRYSGYDKNIRSGRYAIAPGEKVFTTFRHIKNGMQTSLNLTIPESRTMNRLAGTLSKRLMLDSVTIARALTDSAFCAKYGYDTATIASAFIPNTYDIYWNVSMDKLMARIQQEHKKFWNTERMAKAKAIGMTPLQISTLASIIDEETANTAEKPMIAGMYINRLKTDMPLQADPTIKFAWQDFTLRRIYHKLLEIDSPYNTYKNTGLPPGPIKIASIAGIDAVLNYTDHDYLYMCAKEDFSGTHNFARTYGEHLKNAAKYVKALNERNIK